MAAGLSVGLGRWRHEFDELMLRVGARFALPLTRNEIRRLFTGLCQQLPAPRLQLHWSRRRRRHQAVARACHYKQRAEQLV
jgi:hypothetical protein